jgi:hypothetical protein
MSLSQRNGAGGMCANDRRAFAALLSAMHTQFLAVLYRVLQ